MTSRRAVIFTILLFGTIFAAAGLIEKVIIPSPGATGMVSVTDFDLMKPTDARWLKNVDLSGTPGAIVPRNGLHKIDTFNQKVYGYGSIYWQELNYKVLAGAINATYGTVSDSGFSRCSVTYNLTPDPDQASIVDSLYFKWVSGKEPSLLRVSDTFSGHINQIVPADFGGVKKQLGFSTVYHDFTKYKDLLIHCDGSGLPSVLALKDFDDDPSPDTTIYSPRWIDLHPTRPGQPRVRVLDLGTTTTLTGTYEYCYGIGSAFQSGYISDTGYHSIPIKVKGKAVAIDNILDRTWILGDTATVSGTVTKRATRIFLFRRQIDDLEGNLPLAADSTRSNWRLIADFGATINDAPMVIDSGQDRSKSLGDYLLATTIPAPGQPILNRWDTTNTGTGTHFEYDDSLVSVAWSWFDPVTGIESALSRVTCDSIWDTNSVKAGQRQFSIWSIPYLTRDKSPLNHIRIYRSVIDADLVGAGDTTFLYCIRQIPVDYLRYGYEGSMFLMGIEQDSLLQSGPIHIIDQDTTFVAGGTGTTYLNLAAADVPYRFEHEADDGGEVVTRPPVISPLGIPFSDMEYANSRLWGIGDPLYPQRLYYSGLDDINDWNAAYYLSMDESENDELIAVEKEEVSSGDYLYGFKHNGILAVSGTDPEYDLRVMRISDRIGGLSRFAVVKTAAGIFWMSMAHRIYRLDGGKIEYLSEPIRDFIDSVFTKSDDSLVRAYELDGRVCFSNNGDSLVNAVCYDFGSGGWGIETYPVNVKPIGSFLYDTTQNTTGFNENAFWLFEADDSGSYRYTETDSLYDSTSAIDTFEVGYQTPFFGDGDWVIRPTGAKVTCVGDAGQWFVADIYDQDEVKFATDSFAFGSGQDWGEQRFWFSPHTSCRWFSVRFRGNFRMLSNVELYWTRLGRAPAR